MIGYKGKKNPQTWNTHKLNLIHTSLLKACNPMQQSQHYLNKAAGVGVKKNVFLYGLHQLSPPTLL